MNCCLKCDVHEFSPYSGVHVEVILVIRRWYSAVNLSYDRGATAGDMKIVWPFPASNFRILTSSRISGRNKFPCHFFLTIAPWFRFRKVPWFLTFVCCGRFPCYSVHQPAKVCILQPPLRTRRYVGFWISSFPCITFSWNCKYPRLFWCNRNSPKQVEDKFIAISFDFATIISSSSFCSCILFAIVLEQLVKLSAAELKWLMLNKWRRLFHSSGVQFPFVNTSASWCLVSMVPNLNLGIQMNPIK